jgi:hypothetical protein
MSDPRPSALSLSQREALRELRGRVTLAGKRSSRTKTVIFFGPVAEVDGNYVDLKHQVAAELAREGGEYVNFEDHLDAFLEQIGLSHDPSTVEGTSLVNYLYGLCERTTANFLVVDQLNTALRLLCHSRGAGGSQQAVFVKRLHQIMFPGPVVIVLPLLSEAAWITGLQVGEIVPEESKRVYLECSDIDRAYFREHRESLDDQGDQGGVS